MFKQYAMNLRTHLWARYLLGNAGLLMIYLLPQMVGVITDQFQLNPQQSGLFASADLAGSAITSISSFFWIRKTSWKTMAWLGIGIIIMGNLWSVLAGSFEILTLSRIFTGFGQGIAVALTLAIINDSKDTDRNFAIYLIITLLFGAATVELLPHFFMPLQGKHIFGSQILMCVIATPFMLGWNPQNKSPKNKTHTAKYLKFESVMGLLGILLLYVGYGGLWALTERFGTAYGLDYEFITRVISIAILIAVPGLLLPIFVGVKFGRFLPMLFASVCLLLYGILLYFGQNTILFFLSITIGSLGVNMILPYMTGILADSDNTGKSVVMVMPMYAIGFALGPAVLSVFLKGERFLWICVIAIVLFIKVIAIYFWIMLKNKDKTVSHDYQPER